MNRAEALESIQEASANVLEAKGVLETLDAQDVAARAAQRAAQRAAVVAAINTACGPLMDTANIHLVRDPVLVAFDAG